MEVFQVLKKNPLKKKKKRGGFSSFRTQKGGILRKKAPKVEDWKSILNEILTFEKKTTKSGGFSSFDKKSNKKKKKTPKVEVFQVFVTKSGGF